ncbi:uncharacterized protein CC84DRAFT_1167639 [Paraphaeosphaeria sporulosa]|uniref:Uncharacterized protein n=1 Tax=Paraphaeosphaeria sporulosa TaxID=1460663 RepID=A0A177C3S9_9PLEO|nr:uncharacterized protein CC84DRAFT_1167639 [Paraphaeosphaeria sporulosa]OAG01437.1 hypothetical protein CC84DRAFT_1167639 [Paraphaeosphaeria sporulosa]
MPPRERLVRKAPLMERVRAYLDFHDWLLWISEELNTNDWEDFAKDYAFIIGFVFNLVYIVAQANTASGPRNDDILLDSVSGPGWFTWFSRLAVTALSIVAFLNGFLTFNKKRHYRLFEQPIETAPSTPSAHRVRVDSSPAAVTPLRYFQNLLGSASADSRAHPDAGRDVWEISVWDPNPLCLDMFCLFSPLHVVLYWLNLPVPPMDQQPSIRVVTTIAVGAFLSFSQWYLKSSFANQIRDNGVIQREVLHEYDNKFVHPSTQKLYRDVGIQAISKNRSRDSSVGVRGSSDDLASQITTYTPTTIINRTFRTNPNPVYASQYDPDNLRSTTLTPSARPYSNANYSTTSTATGADFSSPIRPSHTPNPFRQSQAQPQFRPSNNSGDGGSLGVFSHANSPLRKSASTNFVRDRDDRGRDSLVGHGVERRTGTPARREGSPLKRVSMPGAGLKASGGESVGSAADRFARWNGGAGSMRRESGRF